MGEAFEVGFVFRRHRGGGVDVEAAVFPGVEDLDALRGQELLLDQEADDFGAEEFFQGFERGFREGVKGGAGRRLEAGGWRWWGWWGEEAVGDEGVEVGMEIEVFAEGVEGHDDAGDALGAGQGGAEVFLEAFMGEGAEALEEVAVALEIGAEHFGDGQDVVAVGHGGEDLVEDEAGGGLDVFLVAGGTEPAAFAGEGEQILVLAVVAANAGKAALEVAALEEFVDDLGDDGAEGAEAGLVILGIGLLECVIMMVGTLPEG